MQNTRLSYAAVFVVLAFSVLFSGDAGAVIGQKYFGDGATPDPAGGWSYTNALDSSCFVCHRPDAPFTQAPDKTNYLTTGHKNMLRKATVFSTRTGPDNLPYDTDSSGHVIFWNLLGPISLGTATTHPPLLDGSCSLFGYPDQSSCESAGGAWTSGNNSLFYIFGGWMKNAGTAGAYNAPGTSIAAPDSISNGGSYSCARCHTTGMTLNTTVSTTRPPEKTYSGINSYVAFDPDSDGPATTASWAFGSNTGQTLEGVQCERCHNATSHSGGGATVPRGVNATSLCVQCHRQEHTVPYTGGGLGANIHPTPFSDNGTLPVSEPTYTLPAIEVGSTGGYAARFYGYSTGMEFLNSVHARFTGNFQQINTSARYNSGFSYGSCDLNGYQAYDPYGCGSLGGSWSDAIGCTFSQTSCEANAGTWTVQQGGCTTCHDVHNSLVVNGQASGALKTRCADCHTGQTPGAGVAPQITPANILHPESAGTPFDSSRFSDVCVVCHMAKQAVTNGDQISTTAHLWRINTSATYTTWPSLDQFNGTNGQTMDKRATMTSETYTLPDGVSRATYTNAVWVDVDLACGQCHKGAVANAPVLSKAQLAISAKTMHGDTAAVSAMTADECLTCHTAIVPGINHHAVRTTCTECHGTAVMPLHKGAVPDKTSNAFCLNCHKNSGPQAVHHAVSTVTATCVSCHTIPGVTVPMANRTDKTVVTTACQLCHASEQTRTTSGTTRAIVVSGAGDNHHNGSGTNASRSVAACIYCHGLGKPFGDASTEVMVDQVAPNTSSCNGACHSSALPSSGTHHTGAGLTPTNGFLCLTCHAPTGPAPAGVTTPTFPPANVADCTACHGTTPMTGTRSVALGAGTNHRQNTTFTPSRCDVCHVNAGIKPTIATCAAQCHADPAKAPVLDSAVLGSYLAGMHDPKVVFVNHAPVALGLRTAYTGTSFASPTIVTNNTNAAAFTDASTDEDANVKTVTVSWGDGVVSSVTTTGTPFTHNYTRAGTYQIIHTVKDNGGLGNTERAFVKIAPPIYTVTGTVSASGSPLSGAIVYLKLNGHTRAIARTAANGIYTFPRVLPGSYTITTVKKGYAFSTVVTVDVTGAATADIAAD